MLRGGRFRTEASTDGVALRADALQYEIGSGPCVDAILDDNVYVTQDVANDERWARWGRQVSTELGLHSVLAYRLGLLDDSDAIAALNVYSDQVGAFDSSRDLGTGLVLATHGSLLVTAQLARDKADNLLKALESNREIGVAMGILMHRHRLDRDQAFAVLRVASTGCQPEARRRRERGGRHRHPRHQALAGLRRRGTGQPLTTRDLRRRRRRHDLQPVGGVDRHHVPGRGHLDGDREAADAQALDAQCTARRVRQWSSASRPLGASARAGQRG